MLLEALASEWIASDCWSLARLKVERKLELAGRPELKETVGLILEAVLHTRGKDKFMTEFMG